MKKIILLSVFISLILGNSGMIAQGCIGEPGKLTLNIYRNLFSNSFEEMTILPKYPQTPDIELDIYSTNIGNNFDNLYGTLVRGFIHVPSSDSVQFNVTGNDGVKFYLSTDQTAANLQLLAYTLQNTNEYEHDKYPTQSSEVVYLEANQYYYFEMLHFDNSFSDHAKVFWKATFLNNSNWNIITAAYLNNLGCINNCPSLGTPCDDGNPNTTNDQEDGYCHCIGEVTFSNPCVGTAHRITNFQFDDITGSSINSLVTAPNYPANPSSSEYLVNIAAAARNIGSNYGNMIQGYLLVPETGDYIFNITGDDQTYLYISSDDDPANKNDNVIYVPSWTNSTEFDKYPSQTSPTISMQAGQLYYVELLHKEASGSDHYSLQWQTPFTEPNVWKRIPSVYWYDYECTLACLPLGTICDDGNPFTNDDQYNEDCDCVGIPCIGSECDSPLANYVPYEKCGLTDQLDNRPENNWLSCTTTSSPNPSRPVGHWIQYDLGERYQIVGSHIWNYNVAGNTSLGFSQVSIDYSEDGLTWTNLGDYIWPLANGSSNYTGFTGPSFSGIFARYILITSTEVNTTCKGMGKIRFDAVRCPIEGTVCDDNNINTVHDKYNANCECIGLDLTKNPCINEILVLGDSVLTQSLYGAKQYISSLSTIAGMDTVGFVAEKYIELTPGFESNNMSYFIASIDTCEQSSSSLAVALETAALPTFEEDQHLWVLDHEDGYQSIYFRIKANTSSSLLLSHPNGVLQYDLLQGGKYMYDGIYHKLVYTKKLISGIYHVSLITPKYSYKESMTVGRNSPSK